MAQEPSKLHPPLPHPAEAGTPPATPLPTPASPIDDYSAMDRTNEDIRRWVLGMRIGPEMGRVHVPALCFFLAAPL